MIPDYYIPKMGASPELGLFLGFPWENGDQSGDELYPSVQSTYVSDYSGDESTDCEVQECSTTMITGYNCRLPGCDPECERDHENALLFPSSPTCDMEFVDTSMVFGLSPDMDKSSTVMDVNDIQLNADEQSNKEPSNYDFSSEVNVQPPSEVDVQPPSEIDVQPPSEIDVQPPSEVDVQPPSEVDVQPPSEVDEQPSEVDVQPPSEVYVQPSFEVNIQAHINDHSYSQQIQPTIVAKEIDANAFESVDSEPQTDSSDDDEVDVVTVAEEYFPSKAQRRLEMKRRSGKQKYTKKQVHSRPKVKESTVKAVLKRTASSRFPAQANAKRRKTTNSVETSPSSSLPSSSASSSSLNNSDVEDFEKRNTHNDSERKRREAQRTALQTLRSRIPELQENPKAPKVLILNTATKLIKQLDADMKTAFSEKKLQLHRNQELKARKKELQKYFNAHCR